MDQEVKLEIMQAGRVATIKHRGSFEELNLIHVRVNEWIKNSNFIRKGIYFSRFDLDCTDFSSDDILFELGVRVSNQIKDENSVRIAEIAERNVLSALYKGSYSNLPSVHGILEDYARKNDLAPMGSPAEYYFNDPLEVKSSELITEVQFTVLDYKPENIQHVPLVNKIERKTIKKQRFAAMEYYGSIEDVFKVRVDLIKWAEKHDIEVNAVHFKYHANPEGIYPGGMVFRIAIPVDGDVKEERNLKVIEIPEHEVLSAIYKGPYVNTPNVHRMMVNYAFENGLELIDFPEEIYLNSIFDVSCDDLLTEVRMDMIEPNFDKNIQIDKIERKTVKKHETAFIRQKGSFEKVTTLRTDLFNWVKRNNIKTSGYPYLRFLNHPRGLNQDDINYDVGIPVDSNMEDVIKVLDYPRHKVLSLNHHGPMSTLRDTYVFIKDYAEEQEFQLLDFPVIIFVDKIPENHEEGILFKIQHPVRKIV
ncbi:MAG: GyrI-like domain-containing protein [Methanobrevibacter sp.]|nr:GyrI-like domain-containing protein [Methanobrevibacter sp.]